LANAALPKGYELSLVICADDLSKKLNKAYRSKDKPANVLSFPITPSSGEIFLNVRLATREARSFGRSGKAHIRALLVHGLLHLLGYDDIEDSDRERMHARQEELLGKFFAD